MNTKLRRPACAACAATALARLPVHAHAAILNPNSSAFDSATVVTRSLNEFVGFTVSFFTHTSPRPSSAARRSARTSGVKPGAEVDRGVAVARQEVGVAPDRQAAPPRSSRGSCRRGDRLVVVGDLERAEAPLAGEDRRDLVLAAALPTSQAVYVCHRSLHSSSAGALAPTLASTRSRAPRAEDRSLADSSFRHWHLTYPLGLSRRICWLPRRRRACPSAALDERVFLAENGSTGTAASLPPQITGAPLPQ